MRSEELKRHLIGLYFKIWDDWVQGTLTCHTFMSHSVLDIYCTPDQTELCNLVGSNSIRVFVCNSRWNVYLHVIDSIFRIAFMFIQHSFRLPFWICFWPKRNVIPFMWSRRLLYASIDHFDLVCRNDTRNSWLLDQLHKKSPQSQHPAISDNLREELDGCK